MNPAIVTLLWAAALAVPMANAPNAASAVHPSGSTVRVKVNISAQDQVKSEFRRLAAKYDSQM